MSDAIRSDDVSEIGMTVEAWMLVVQNQVRRNLRKRGLLKGNKEGSWEADFESDAVFAVFRASREGSLNEAQVKRIVNCECVDTHRRMMAEKWQVVEYREGKDAEPKGIRYRGGDLTSRMSYVDSVLGLLPVEDQDLVRDKCLYGQSLRDIAECRGQSPSAVTYRFSKVIARLKEEYGGN